MEIAVILGMITSLILIALQLRKMMIESYHTTLERQACRVHNLFDLLDSGDVYVHMYWMHQYESWMHKHELNAHTVNYEWWMEMVVDGAIRV